MDLKDIELQACPHCGGDGLLEVENGWCCYVTCMDCGAHTAQGDYHTPEDRLDAANIFLLCLPDLHHTLPSKIASAVKMPSTAADMMPPA